MPKKKWNLNTVYVSERLQESLRGIQGSALTTIVAPMGYGKTTAINWYLSGLKGSGSKVIRISVYSDNLAIFWKSVQDAFSHAGFDFLSDYPFPSDAAGESILADEICHVMSGGKNVFCFIDDFHLMTDRRISDYICVLANRLPENVHLIIASRDSFIPTAEILRLGSRLHRIGVEELRLNHTELSVYSRNMGLKLTDNEIDSLIYSSEGWFSAVYLNLRSLFEHGALPGSSSDIYDMFSAALIEPLPEKERMFLSVMGLADEFTMEMAEFVTEDPDTEKMMAALTEQNAFVKRLSDGKTFRFHHMMKECAERFFDKLSKKKRVHYRNRYGKWYEEHGLFIHALWEYEGCGSYDALLNVVQKDAGILLASLKPSDVLSWLDKIPPSVLKDHPLAILVLMRSAFNWHEIPKMLGLKDLFLESIKEHTEMDPVERGNLLGEFDLILSFLQYNDISAMSALHRRASEQMTGIAVSLKNTGGWTFGSPSVLMMFHRDNGGLSKELKEMDDCMPHYYKITAGHGMGAEKIMRAEACLCRTEFTDAEIALLNAYDEIKGSGQENMLLCCDFTAYRLSLCKDVTLQCSFEERYKELIRSRNISLINIWNASAAYYYALLGENEKIPEVYSSHKLSSMNILAPGMPMHQMIENRVFLSQGEYAAVIAREKGLLAMCEGLHYALVSLHIKLQTAGALEMTGKRKEAAALLKEAVKEAQPDGFIIPFAENFKFIRGAFESLKSLSPFAGAILEAGEQYVKRLDARKNRALRPEALSSLTDREFEIVKLKTERLSNREIAERLFVAESSIKQYMNRIYMKLMIEGSTKEKREKLLKIMG